MAGGGQNSNASSGGQGVAGNAAQIAMAGGAAGSAGGATMAAQQNIPQWQKGLLGAVTGSPQYGANAPAIHQLLQGAMQRGQPGQGVAQAAGVPGQPPMQQRPIVGGQMPPGMPQGGQLPPGMTQGGQMPPGQLPGGQMPPQGMPQQGAQPGMTPQGLAQGGLSPQMLAQLQQQYPQLFAQKPPGM